SKVTWAWNALRLGPVNFRAASLNDAITSSVRTFIIPSLGPALESETTTEGSRTENSNHAETILRGFPKTLSIATSHQPRATLTGLPHRLPTSDSRTLNAIPGPDEVEPSRPCRVLPPESALWTRNVSLATSADARLRRPVGLTAVRRTDGFAFEPGPASWKHAPTPERCPRQEPLGRNRPSAFTLCYKVSGPSALPPRFEPVDPRERDEND